MRTVFTLEKKKRLIVVRLESDEETTNSETYFEICIVQDKLSSAK